MVLSPDGAVLLLIDLQERLMPVIADHEVVVARAVRLAEAATLLDVPVRATEQNPAGLGRTVPPLSGYPQAVLAKTTFSAAADPGFAALLPAEGEIVVAGVEAHVCVLQTVLDLLDAGRRVVWAADATGSRDPADRAAAIDRARQHGAEIVTSEMVLFEWLRDARHPRFREVHKLLRLRDHSATVGPWIRDLARWRWWAAVSTWPSWRVSKAP
jgi:nicotinamidase-related amidase